MGKKNVLEIERTSCCGNLNKKPLAVYPKPPPLRAFGRPRYTHAFAKWLAGIDAEKLRCFTFPIY